MKEPQMIEIAHLIDEVLSSPGDEKAASNVRKEVKVLISKFPLYKNLVKALER
jgi:glycine/serine hydroxymethyltransferase